LTLLLVTFTAQRRTAPAAIRNSEVPSPMQSPFSLLGLVHASPVPSCPIRVEGRIDRVTIDNQPSRTEEETMVALLVLLLILAVFGGLGFAAHFLWFVLIAALVLWALGFLIGGVESGVGRRRWYGRW
jgi:hypothetical protein